VGRDIAFFDTETAEVTELASTLREVAETLAPMDRTPCSAGERDAAVWIAERLRAAGVESVVLEDEPSWGLFPPLTTAIGLLGMAGAALARAGRRGAGVLLAAASVAALVDEVQNGPRIARRALRRRRQTVNVLARAGDPHGERTLLVLAHHDAPQTGVVFDQTLQQRLHERFPHLLEGRKTQLPQWWMGLAAPLGGLLSALTRRRGPATAGMIVGTVGVALAADIWRSPTVPGANDNLSGVAVLVALAELLREERPDGLRVLLVSCGAEETLQDGIRAFMARHSDELEPGRTFVLNYDTVGSRHLMMIEAEGPFWMERYPGESFRDLVAQCARRCGIDMERGLRARASTDSVITARAGHPTATLGSLTDWRAPANYHLLTDVPENLDYSTIEGAARLAHATAMELARAARSPAGAHG